MAHASAVMTSFLTWREWRIFSVSFVAPACTSCTSPCSSGLILSLDQNNASHWGSGGSGFTKYQYTWRASTATSATIQFQFYTITSGNYWDIATVSVKDSSGVQNIVNGNFTTKLSWNETCGMISCAFIKPYGPGGSLDYCDQCYSSTNYFSVSQTFTTIPCATYNISFQLSRYAPTTNTAKAFVYIYWSNLFFSSNVHEKKQPYIIQFLFKTQIVKLVEIQTQQIT